MFASTLCHWAGSLQTASCLALCRLPEGSEGAGAQAGVGQREEENEEAGGGAGPGASTAPASWGAPGRKPEGPSRRQREGEDMSFGSGSPGLGPSPRSPCEALTAALEILAELEGMGGAVQGWVTGYQQVCSTPEAFQRQHGVSEHNQVWSWGDLGGAPGTVTKGYFDTWPLFLGALVSLLCKMGSNTFQLCKRAGDTAVDTAQWTGTGVVLEWMRFFSKHVQPPLIHPS